MSYTSSRHLLILVAVVALGAGFAATASHACERDRTPACAVVLKMTPHKKVIVAQGVVSGLKPDYYFRFAAKARQKLIISTHGGGLKTGPGIPLTFPNGSSDALEEGVPYRLPQTGSYFVMLHANTMSNGPFGRFTMRMTIQ